VPPSGDHPDHRHRGVHGDALPSRPTGAARSDRRHRRRGRARREALLPPQPARRDDDRVPQLDEALLGRLPRGLLLQAAARLRAFSRSTAKASSRRPAASAGWSPRHCSAATRRARRRSPAASRTSSVATTSSSSSRTTGSPSSGGRTPNSSRSPGPIGAPLLATNDSHYCRREDAVAHRRAPVRPDRGDDRRPEAFQVRGRGALSEGRRGDAHPVLRAPRGLRQPRCGSRSAPTSISSSGRRPSPSSPSRRSSSGRRSRSRRRPTCAT